MGNDMIHFNTCSISTIISASYFHTQKIFELYKAKEDENGRKDSMTFVVNTEIITSLLAEVNVNEADRELLLQLFQLLDVSGFDEVNLRDFLCCFALILDNSLEDRLRNAINNFYLEREAPHKKEIVWLMKLLNNTCYYFGDKRLLDSQVVDLVDSMYTLAGKVDGEIYAEELTELLLSHPILEMFISMQYQGTERSVIEA